MRTLRGWRRSGQRSTTAGTPSLPFRPRLESLDARIAPAVITAAQSGLWNAGSTWTDGVVPGAGDSAVIGSGNNVTLNTNATIAGVNVQAGGQLTFDPAATRVL